MERAGAMVQVVADSVVEVEVEVLMEEEKEVGWDEVRVVVGRNLEDMVVRGFGEEEG